MKLLSLTDLNGLSFMMGAEGLCESSDLGPILQMETTTAHKNSSIEMMPAGEIITYSNLGMTEGQ